MIFVNKPAPLTGFLLGKCIRENAFEEEISPELMGGGFGNALAKKE